MLIRTDELGTETPLFYKREGLYVIRIWSLKKLSYLRTWKLSVLPN